MNAEDTAYYERLETDRKTAELRSKLADLRDNGVRVRMRSGVGSVAVNAFGMVTDVVVDRRNSEHIAEEVLADYLVEAIRNAGKRAEKTRDHLLSYDLLSYDTVEAG
jgi:DNA-binding protein YbaB